MRSRVAYFRWYPESSQNPLRICARRSRPAPRYRLWIDARYCRFGSFPTLATLHEGYRVKCLDDTPQGYILDGAIRMVSAVTGAEV